MIDPATGKGAVFDGSRFRNSSLTGPYRFDAPDLLVGWEGGYRNSWECATGQVTEEVITDNTKSWSGDHCVDPSIVPGVFFCNRAVSEEKPRLIDIPASVMRLFGQEIPGYMQGRMILPEGPETGSVRGMLDPNSLDQSGAAPGALIFPPVGRKRERTIVKFQPSEDLQRAPWAAQSERLQSSLAPPFSSARRPMPIGRQSLCARILGSSSWESMGWTRRSSRG